LRTGGRWILERLLEPPAADDAEDYFPVQLVGITASPVRMRFGRCLWKLRLDEHTVRHRIWLVGEGGDDETLGPFGSLHQPELARSMEQSLIRKARMDALISEPQHAGALRTEADERIRSISAIDNVPFADVQEL
jgi:hypothetical protein